MTRFEELMKEARILGDNQNTEWAEDHEDRYDAFAEACESGYDEGQLTAKEFNELILTGLYDYDGDLKEE